LMFVKRNCRPKPLVSTSKETRTCLM
jgi:hypothetical protein